MKIFNKDFFKRMLAAHSGIGLAVSVLMYLVCITGTVAVFYPEFERWEQPQVQEYSALPSTVLNDATKAFYQASPKSEKPLYIVMPTNELPRAHISDGETEFWLNQDGSLSEAVESHWTHLLTELHVNLYLPQQLGLVIVGILGVMMTALIISGVLAHHRILKDAFRLRWGGTGQQQQIDLHNRLSVWALPFHFVIAVTGAFFGIVGLLIVSATELHYNGDRDALIADIYGTDPKVTEQAPVIDYVKAFESLAQVAPQATPIYTVVQSPNTTSQYLEIAATLPNRLIYSEIYRFSAAGEYLDHQGFSDGPTFRQVVYSVYRIHFGHFGGYPTKIAYVLLGLALTIVCVSGINIWLNRRGKDTWLNHAWVGFVWGIPLALTVSAISSLVIAHSGAGSFLLVLCTAIAYCCSIKSTVLSNYRLVIVLALALIALIVVHVSMFSNVAFTGASLVINSFICFWLIITAGFVRYYQAKVDFVSEYAKPLSCGKNGNEQGFALK